METFIGVGHLLTDIYSLILAELRERGCAYVDRYPPYYITSIGCHLFNLANQQSEVFIEGGRISDTRLHIIFCSPPGMSKTYWLEQFLRGNQALLSNSGIDITMEAEITTAGFVGTTRFVNGESVREPGLAESNSTAICGMEEFSAVTNMFKIQYGSGLDTALLQALDSGYVYKRLASGSVKYHTCITLHTGCQPARFDLSSGLGRRFVFIEFIPMRKDFRILTLARRKSRGIRHNPVRTDLIRRAIRQLRVDLANLKDYDIDDAFYDFMDAQRVVHFEEALYEKMLLGFNVMTGNINDKTLFCEMTPEAKNFLADEVTHRRNIKKGSEFSQVFAVLRDAGGGASIDYVREMLLDYGCDYAESTALIDLMGKIKLINQIGRNLVLPGEKIKEEKE